MPAAEEEIPADDTIRLLAKLKKKRLALAKGLPSAAAAPVVKEPSASGRGGTGLPGSGVGISVGTGPGFPFPWYTKTISGKVDKNWRQPENFAPDTVCEVLFVVDRSGAVSNAKISKHSWDAYFDELALRAVLYSNPFPPLPNGYSDSTLSVHMVFKGRRP
jgi:TonB family protein